MLYKATFKKSGKDPENPFRQRFFLRLPAEASAIVDLPDGKFSLGDIKRMAKEATPDGYDFVDVAEFHY